MAAISDQEQFYSLRQGDERALGYIIIRHGPALQRYVNQLLQEKNPVEAEDIVSRGFMGLWKKRAALNDPAHLRNYLYKTCWGLALNFLKKDRRYRELYRNLTQIKSREEGYPDTGQVEAEIIGELALRARGLPAQCEKIWRLHFLQKMDVGDIALQLDIKPQTVTNQLTNARNFFLQNVNREDLLLILIALAPWF